MLVFFDRTSICRQAGPTSPPFFYLDDLPDFADEFRGNLLDVMRMAGVDGDGARNSMGSLVIETDDELVALARAGKGDAFTELVRRHTRTIYRLALRMTGSGTDAEDVLQETFLQVHRKFDTYRREAKFSTWLYGIATNAALMLLRSRRSHPIERPLADYLPTFDETGAS
jgi:hypothetical protein